MAVVGEGEGCLEAAYAGADYEDREGWGHVGR